MRSGYGRPFDDKILKRAQRWPGRRCRLHQARTGGKAGVSPEMRRSNPLALRMLVDLTRSENFGGENGTARPQRPPSRRVSFHAQKSEESFLSRPARSSAARI